MKRYVTEKTEKTVDGDKLQIVTVYKSKSKMVSYLIFVEK